MAGLIHLHGSIHKIKVLGDNDEIIFEGMLPDLPVRGLPKSELLHVPRFMPRLDKSAG